MSTSTEAKLQKSSEPSSPALQAMAAVAAAAALARAMAEAQKDGSPGNNSPQVADTSASSPHNPQALAAALAAATGANTAAASQAMIQQAATHSGGLMPGWTAQGMTGAMASAMAGQLALQKWAHMTGAAMPQAYTSLGTPPTSAPKRASDSHLPSAEMPPHRESAGHKVRQAASTRLQKPSPSLLVMWTPVDDALLKASIEGGMSLSDIAAHIPFTSPFSVRDLEVRWRAILYDPIISMEVAAEVTALQGGKRVNLPHKRKSGGSELHSSSPRDQQGAAGVRPHPPGTAGYLLSSGVAADMVSGHVMAVQEKSATSSGPCLAAVDGCVLVWQMHACFWLYLHRERERDSYKLVRARFCSSPTLQGPLALPDLQDARRGWPKTQRGRTQGSGR